MKEVFLESHNLKNRYSGFGQYNFHLLKALSKIDQQDIRFVVHAKHPDRWKQEFGTEVGYRKYHSLSRHPIFRIRKRYDLWHCLNQNIKIEPYHHIPYLLTVHDIHFITEGSPDDILKKTQLFKEKLKRCHAIIYISEFAKKDTHVHFEVPDVPEYVIHNGNTLTEITLTEEYRPPVLPEQPYLFSIGDFTDRKNFLSLVEMLRLVPEYHLVLAGSNASDYAGMLRTKIAEYSLEDRVIFPGKIEDMEKQYYLKHCTAFVFPSKREGFGIPPIEAMRFGKPVFLSNNTSLPEIGGEHAFYWDHFDTEYMVDVFKQGMEKYDSNKEFYTQWYTDRALQFNWDQTARQYLKVYQHILS